MADQLGADDAPLKPEIIDTSEAARALGRLGGLKGGLARAESLSPERRSEIAREAVKARWARARGSELPAHIPKATHTGTLKIGDIELPCAVLEDGTRVFTQAGLLEAIGRNRSVPNRRSDQDEELPHFLRAQNLRPFISKELERTSKPMLFKPIGNVRGVARGYRVELLTLVCHAYLEARAAGALKRGDQSRIAAQCEVLIRGLATVGIIALVDEATGYQADRERTELRRILEAYISKELLPWTERFPRDYYQELFRLNGWQFDPVSVKRPKMVGKLTVELIYDKLPPGVLEELRARNPVVYRGGTRKHRHHQLLTQQIGNPHLEKQVASVTTLMRVSGNWNMFKRLFDKAFPPRQKQGELFPAPECDGEVGGDSGENQSKG